MRHRCWLVRKIHGRRRLQVFAMRTVATPRLWTFPGGVAVINFSLSEAIKQADEFGRWKPCALKI